MLTVIPLSPLSGLVQATPCENLQTLARPNTTITAAQLVPAGQAAGGGALPAHCRVAAVVRPVPDSQITVEIWMPVENWNGKFQAVGNGGWAGTVSLGAM